MADPAPENREPVSRPVLAGLLVAGLGYAVVTGLMVVWGLPNSDEGWYLANAARVLRGDFPYRDFAYTQTPLLPFVYALPLAAWDGSILHIGRVTSAVLSLVAFAAATGIARRLGGLKAAAWTAALCASNIFVVYNLTLVKTYAAVASALSLGFYLAVVRRPSAASAAWGGAALAAAPLIRLSAAGFAVTAVAAAWLRPLNRKSLLFGLGAAVIIGLALVLQDASAAVFGVLEYHQFTQRGFEDTRSGRGFLTQLAANLFAISPPQLLLIVLLGLLCVIPRTRKALGRNLVIVAVGFAVFALVHVGSTAFPAENLVPAWPLGVAASVVSLFRVHRPGVYSPSFLRPELVLALVLVASVVYSAALVAQLTQSGTPPVTRVTAAAELVARVAPDDATVLAFDAQDIALESRLRQVPSVSLGRFSVQDVSDADARRYRLLNDGLLVELLRSRAADVVIWTSIDQHTVAGAGVAWAEVEPSSLPISRALASSYRCAASIEGVGQYAATVWIMSAQDGDATSTEASDDAACGFWRG